MKLATFYLLPAILFLAMIGCSNSDEPIIDENLLDIVWRIDSLRTSDGKIVPQPDEHMTIQFREYMKVEGHAACNTYNGSYGISDNKSLVIDVLTRTEAGCGHNPYLLVLEDIFIHALENVTAFEIAESKLNLYDNDRQYVLSFSIE